MNLSSWNKFLSLFCYYIISLSLILYIHYYGSQNNQQSFRLFLSVAAALNGLSDSVKFICEDVFDLLPKLEEKGEKYDVVILDPPAFTKSRSSVKNAVKGYREINLRAMKLVKDGGFLATCDASTPVTSFAPAYPAFKAKEPVWVKQSRTLAFLQSFWIARRLYF